MRVTIVLMLLAASPAAAENKGQEALKAFNYCLAEATKQCSTGSIRCTSFRRGFVKSCMMQIGIEPDYITLMLDS